MKKEDAPIRRTCGRPRKAARNNTIVFQRYVLKWPLKKIGAEHGITHVTVIGVLRLELSKYREEYSNLKLPDLSPV